MSHTTTLILIRHGDLPGKGIFYGHKDQEMTSEGEQNIARLGERLKNETIHRFYSSDLNRSLKSAQIIASHHAIEVESNRNFRELDMGNWDGRSFDELWNEDGEELKKWWGDLANYKTPGGESLGDLKARVLPALDSIIAQNRGKTLCLVAHGGVNRVILFSALGMELHRFHSISQDYACLNRIRYFEDSQPVVDKVNVVV